MSFAASGARHVPGLFALAAVVISALSACILSSGNEITAFGFVDPAVSGTISGTSISVETPWWTDPSTLVATFSTTGAQVLVGSHEQVSGETRNDFTHPVKYVVTATDGTFATYTVSVHVEAIAWTDHTDDPGAAWWYAVATSADGKRLAICNGDDGDIWTSSDSGGTWVDRSSAGERNWFALASSSDGTHLAAVDYNGSIWTSANAGVDWTEQTSAGTDGTAAWAAVASSADGSRLVAVDDGDPADNPKTPGGYIWTSSDGGAHWTERMLAGQGIWDSVAMSEDGMTIIAGDNTPGYLWTSNDGGASWQERTAPGTGSWLAVAASSDGKRLAAASQNGDIWTSTDGGADWTDRTTAGTRAWDALTSSANGLRLAAGSVGGDIWTSADGGETWVDQTGAGSGGWTGIASSSDGTRLTAVIAPGDVFTAK